jgi:hypothetical protein
MIIDRFARAKAGLRYALAAMAVGAAMASAPAAAQTSFASGTQIVLPLAAHVSVYHTTVFVRNPNVGPITLNVRYIQSNNGTAPTGERSCPDVALAANESATFDLGAQCSLNGVDDDFGMLIVQDSAGTNPFFAYSRTDTPEGVGFSVEGFPSENFSGSPADVLGLKTTAAAPNYRSNCFVGSLADPVNWQIQLYQSGSETLLGTVSGSLGALQTTRVLDVFSSAGLAGDFADVRATFSTGDAGPPSFVGFCTVETSANGSADFRVAKNLDVPSGGGGGAPTFAGSWHLDDVQALLGGTGVYQFIGSTTVTLASPSTLSGFASGWFAKQSAGTGPLSLAVCYQDQSGPGPMTVLGSAATVTVGSTAFYGSANGSGSVPAGTYTVGSCAQNLGVNSINKSVHSAGAVYSGS